MGRSASSSLLCWVGVVAALGVGQACGRLVESTPDDVAWDASTDAAFFNDDDAGADGRPDAPMAIVDLAAGNSSTCIVVASGGVYCWGANHRKQLGAATAPGTCSEGRPCSRRPMRVAGISDAKRVAVGDAWACVVHATGAVSCWGSNAALQLGHADGDATCGDTACNAAPVEVKGLPAGDRVVQVVAGGDETQAATCARVESGSVYCWGRNHVGQLGTGSLTPGTSATPVQVAGLQKARLLAASPQGGNLGICAVLESNELSCWGDGDHWMIGRDPSGTGCGCFPTAAKPTLAPAADVATIGITDGTSVIARTDRSTIAYGFTGYGLKPVGDLPEKVSSVANLPNTVVEVAAGARHACARTATNEVWCWGDAHLGSLGRGGFAGTDSCGDKRCSPAAAMIPGVRGTRLVAGVNGTFLLTGERTILAWGANQYGQLGHEAALDVESVEGLPCAPRPVPVEGLP